MALQADRDLSAFVRRLTGMLIRIQSEGESIPSSFLHWPMADWKKAKHRSFRLKFDSRAAFLRSKYSDLLK